MNINKQEMTLAFLQRENTFYMKKFIGFLDQLAGYCVRKLKVSDLYRDDIKQIAVEHAFRKMELYDPDHGSAAYSYFYKVIYMRCLYELRADKARRQKAPSTCSLENFSNLSDECDDGAMNAPADSVQDDGFVTIDGTSYDRRLVMAKIAEAKSLVRRNKLCIRHNNLYSLKEEMYHKVDDDLLKLTCLQILRKKMRKGYAC